MLSQPTGHHIRPKLGLKLCGVKIELIGSGKQNDSHLVKTLSNRIKRVSQKQLQRQNKKEG